MFLVPKEVGQCSGLAMPSYRSWLIVSAIAGARQYARYLRLSHLCHAHTFFVSKEETVLTSYNCTKIHFTFILGDWVLWWCVCLYDGVKSAF